MPRHLCRGIIREGKSQTFWPFCTGVNLYQGITDNWVKRQELNGGPVMIPLLDAILQAADSTLVDRQAKTRYFDMTYIVITLPEVNSAVESVSLYQFYADKTLTQLGDSQVITIR
jgi:hypothetical protein